MKLYKKYKHFKLKFNSLGILGQCLQIKNAVCKKKLIYLTSFTKGLNPSKKKKASNKKKWWNDKILILCWAFMSSKNLVQIEYHKKALERNLQINICAT